MDHKDQHHEHHQKEREEQKKEQKQHELQVEKNAPGIHPGWFLAIGVLLIVGVILVWTFAL